MFLCALKFFEKKFYSYKINHTWFKQKYKSKPIPLQGWAGPEGSSRLRLPDFKTIAT
jgi:hypothetical protein